MPPLPKRKAPKPTPVVEPSPTIRAGDVEELARWLHETSRQFRDMPAWANLNDEHRNVWRHVARRLVEDPPPQVRKIKWSQ